MFLFSVLVCSHWAGSPVSTYVSFSTDWNLYNKKKSLLASTECTSTYLPLIVLWLFLLSECEKEQTIPLIIHTNPNIGNLVDLSFKFCKINSWGISVTLSFYISLTPTTCTPCLIFQIWCNSDVKRWLPINLNIL